MPLKRTQNIYTNPVYTGSNNFHTSGGKSAPHYSNFDHKTYEDGSVASAIHSNKLPTGKSYYHETAIARDIEAVKKRRS